MLHKAALTRIHNGSSVGFVIPTKLILLDSGFPIQQTLTKHFSRGRVRRSQAKKPSLCPQLPALLFFSVSHSISPILVSNEFWVLAEVQDLGYPPSIQKRKKKNEGEEKGGKKEGGEERDCWLVPAFQKSMFLERNTKQLFQYNMIDAKTYWECLAAREAQREGMSLRVGF